MSRHTALLVGFLCVVLLLAACAAPPAITPTPQPSPTYATPSPSVSLLPSSTPRRFLPPSQPLSTRLPPPADPIVLPPGTRSIVLLGMDSPEPFTGRTDAIFRFLYHPDHHRAVLINLAPELFVYLPGENLQRLSSAYALGGFELLAASLDYSFGVRPERYIAAHPEDFIILVNELGGMRLNLPETIPHLCQGQLLAGSVFMDGEVALCYARLREGADQSARASRQSQLLQALLLRFLQDGNLRKLPELFPLFLSRLDTNLKADEVLAAIPFLLTLANPEAILALEIGPAQSTRWQHSQNPPATVLLPDGDALHEEMLRAAGFLDQPAEAAPLSATLAAQLTFTPLPLTATPTPTRIPPTPTPTPLQSPSVTAAASAWVSPTSLSSATATPLSTATATPSPAP